MCQLFHVISDALASAVSVYTDIRLAGNLLLLGPLRYLSSEVDCSLALLSLHGYTLFFYKNKVYKNIEAQNC